MNKLMKKIFIFSVIASLMIAFTACNSKPAEDNKEKVETTEVEEKKEEAKEEAKEEEKEETKDEEKAEEKKVVAGTVAIANILDRLEYDNVVGVPETKYSLPERYKDAGNIGTPMKPDAEIVKSLEPDLFISSSSLEESNRPAMENLGIDSEFIDLSNYDNILKSIEDISKQLNTEEKGQEVIAEIKKDAEEAIASTEGKTSPKVLFIFGTPKSVMVGNENSYVGSLMKMLNINNIASDASEEYTPLSLENIVEDNPDIVLVMNHVNPVESQKMMQAEFDRNPAWSNLNAYKNDKIIYLDNDIFSVTGNVRVGDALKDLVEMVYED
ncbi:MAG: ABC transporter substrate-binding protein [Tissierellia bacterium]|nr:ABC transporter substrate-binding protein [Tissierellia bacterium]